jgi:signal transduction histidine kinase
MMATANTTAGAQGREAGPPALPRWHRLLYWLVAFAVLTVSVGLYHSHQYVRIYVRSAAVNQAWTERLHACSKLGQLAASVNAPGNDVFQSHQVAAEEVKLREALRGFNQHLDTFREELRANAEGDEAAAVAGELQTFQGLVGRMAGEARDLFAQCRKGQTREAGERMAAMDRQYARAIQALERSRGEIAGIQKQHFDDQAALAALLQRSQYAASTLILLMIGGLLAYGHRVRRRVETTTREKEGYIKALRDSEASLDRRVRERTAELVRANEALRKEVEDRRRAEEAMRRSEDRSHSLVEVRQQLLRKLMSAQEDERRRIARDLHDEIGQALTSLLIGLRTVADADSLEVARGRVEDLRRVAASAIEEVRRLARGLRPSALDDLGLAAALERYAADYAQAHGIEVKVQAPDPVPGRLTEEVETALYRIAQEALTNTAKHAAAQHVRIAVAPEPGGVRLTVSDDGSGFTCREHDTAGRLGLSGMEERAALLNGSVTVASDPGRGTRVTVYIPCAEEAHGEDSRPSGG